MKNRYRLSISHFVLITIIVLFIVNDFAVFSQTSIPDEADKYLDSRGEVYFNFSATHEEINNLTRIISIDRVIGEEVFAYANRKEFENFKKLNISYKVLIPPSFQPTIRMSNTIADLKAWDSYPTYSAYVSMMEAFAGNYPDLCSLQEIGTSINGRKLLFVKISDNVTEKEAEPEFMFSSSMHGDELTGFMLSLRLIDYLLINYETDPYIKRLVDSAEIWINPLSNPDGTYFSGNNTVAGATRGNSNDIDLNRNFPDAVDGQHPDGEVWQQENVAMMNFMQAHNFILSANYHGGAEVLNYPWDNRYRRHADDTWFQYVSLNYADTAKKYGGPSYFSDISNNGIINGYDWYAIAGGRQDYMNYFCHSREITIEVSETKLPAGVDLPTFWDYNHSAMLHYIENCLYGIRGIVTDSATHEPIRAKLEISGHDIDSAQIYSNAENGNYHRMIAPGTYDLIFSAPGYKNKTIEDVEVENYKSQVWLNAELDKGESIPDITPQFVVKSESCFSINNDILFIDLPESGELIIDIFSINGQPLYSTKEYMAPGKSRLILPIKECFSGIYFCRICYKGDTKTIKMIR